jgi:ABC-type molybdate transport system substrate-binding protein
VKVPGFSDRSARVTAGVLKTSERPTAALRFARYLSARDKGLQVFARRGYAPAEGDEWASRPELLFFGGAMLRPAVEETIAAFEQREGVQVKTVFNGCGLLLSQMRVGEKPDAYLACDVSFLDPVRDRFGPAVELSRNRIVILVEKGNPKNIQTLEDLARPGLALGLAHEEHSTLGALTRRILEGAGLYDRVVKNRKTEAATADFLVNQMLGGPGALDAVIVYASNAAATKERLETVPIDLSSAIAVQPFAVGRDSRYPNLMNRLLAALRSEESEKRFKERDFIWGAEQR